MNVKKFPILYQIESLTGGSIIKFLSFNWLNMSFILRNSLLINYNFRLQILILLYK